MRQLDDVLKVVEYLNRRGIKASAVHVLAWGDFRFGERQMYKVLRKLVSQGKLVRIGHKHGYALPI